MGYIIYLFHLDAHEMLPYPQIMQMPLAYAQNLTPTKHRIPRFYYFHSKNTISQFPQKRKGENTFPQ
jgi:hypothetical protein